MVAGEIVQPAAPNDADKINDELALASVEKKAVAFDPMLEPISQSQIALMFACAAEYGVHVDTVKTIANGHGYASRKDIKRKDFEGILRDIKSAGQKGGEHASN